VNLVGIKETIEALFNFRRFHLAAVNKLLRQSLNFWEKCAFFTGVRTICVLCYCKTFYNFWIYV